MRIERKPSSRTRCSCATASTAKANRTWYSLLNFGDEREKECALRGLIESPTDSSLSAMTEKWRGISKISILSRIRKHRIR